MSIGILRSWKAQRAQKQASKRVNATIDARAISDEIDRQIKEDSKKIRKVHNILLIGCNDYDVSIILRQMKIGHHDGYTHEERMEFRPTIWQYLLEISRSIVQVIRDLHVVPATLASEENWERIVNHPTAVDDTDFSLSPELAEAVRDLWSDDMIPVLLESPSHFSLTDNAAYFFSEACRITASEYIPSNEDILRAPVRTDAGITETYFKMDKLSLRLCYITGRPGEQRKWFHHFDDVTIVVFCASLLDYDQVDEDGRNQLEESFILFESVINSRWFQHTSIVLFFTGFNEFVAKLPMVPLETYFPEYTSGADVNEAVDYILGQLMQANRAHLTVYFQIAQATETSNIQMVSIAVKEKIMIRKLEESNLSLLDCVRCCFCLCLCM
ncbi:G-protein alpha subunit [Lactarius indigo]|nr:G-protein alpha subunit [Lactarius indigo]